MKHFTSSLKAILTVIAFSFAGCQDTTEMFNTPSTLSGITEYVFSSQSERRELSFSASSNWVAELVPASASSWVSLDKSRGNAGANTITFITTANTDESIRSARVEIRTSDATHVVDIEQSGSSVEVSDPLHFVVSEVGSVLELPLSGSSYEVEVPSSSSDWLSAGISGESLIMVVSPSSQDRSVSFHLRNLYDSSVQSVVIDQLVSGTDACSISSQTGTLSASTKVNYFTWQGGTTTVEITSPSGSWEIGSFPSWCSVVRNGNFLSISVSERSNTLKADRVGSIRLSSGDLSYSLTIVQKGNVTTSSEETTVQEEVQATSLSASTKVNYYTYTGGSKTLDITCDGNWSVSTPTASWCSVVRNGNQLTVNVSERSSTLTADRVTSVHLSSGSLSYSLTIVQKGNTGTVVVPEEKVEEKTETPVVEEPVVETPIVEEPVVSTYYAEKEVLTLQKATVGKGIDIIIMGDGFLKADLTRGGRYENIMKETADHFFSIYPYSAYREYFNVYMVAATSTEEGVSGEFKATVNNRFGSKYWTGTSISCSESTVKAYAKVVPTYTSVNTQTVIVVLNSKKYAGTCIMSKSGLSISLCPMPESSDYRRTFRAIVTHEAGGHGFPKLMDEYFTAGKTISSSEVTTLKSWKSVGHIANLDFTDSQSSVSWSDFFNYSQYKKDVKVVKGGYTYQNGVWRCSDNSCMKDNSAYYNVVSRWAIVKKIHAMAGTSYSFEQFLKDDQIPAQTRSVVSDTNFEQLGSPRLMD